MRDLRRGLALVGGLATLSSMSAWAQSATDVGEIHASFTFSNASFASGGVGLRNLASGTVTLSGLAGRTKAAFLYWTVISTGKPTEADATMHVQRLFPKPSGVVNAPGTVIGTGSSACWPGTELDVFRARLPASLITANGSYLVSLENDQAAGAVDGRDPYTSAPKLPLVDGASIVAVGTGTNNTVVIYDKGLAGNVFHSNQPLTYSLHFPFSPSGTVLLDTIAADGQFGLGRRSVAGAGGKVTTINGVGVSGPGTGDSDSDWDGASGGTARQLWDDNGHDVSSAALDHQNMAISVVGSGAQSFDCVAPVANVALLAGFL